MNPFEKKTTKPNKTFSKCQNGLEMQEIVIYVFNTD